MKKIALLFAIILFLFFSCSKNEQKSGKIWKAIAYNDIEQVKKLLARDDFDLNQTDSAGCSLLYRAVEEQDTLIVELLLKKGVNPDFGGENQKPPLFIAVFNCDLAITKLLLEHGANPNIKYEDKTALKIAIENNCRTLTDFLLNNGADFTDDPKVILLYAVQKGDFDLLKKMLDKGVSLPDSILTYVLGYNGDSIEMAKFLIQHGANVNVDVITDILYGRCGTFEEEEPALIYAIEKKYEVLVKMMIEHGAELIDNQALYYALRWGNKEIIDMMLERGAAKLTDYYAIQEIYDLISDEDSLGILIANGLPVIPEIKSVKAAAKMGNPKALLFMAVFNEDTALVAKQLSILGNDTQIRGVTPFEFAIKNAKLSMVKYFLRHGADVNENLNGSYPLHIAVKNNLKDIAEYLLSKGADVNKKDQAGQSPLFYAIGNTELLTFLLSNGADPNVRDTSGNTPLLLACPYKTDAIEILLQYGAEINVKNNRGETPLTKLLSAEKYDLAEEMISNGADVNLGSPPPITIAVRKHNREIIRELCRKNVSIPEGIIQDLFLYGDTTGNFELTQYLLDCGASLKGVYVEEWITTACKDVVPVYLYAYYPLVNYLILTEQYDFAKFAIKHGAEVNNIDTGFATNGETALSHAVEAGRLDLVKMIIEYAGEDLPPSLDSDITIAEKNNYTEIAEYLKRIRE